MFLYYIFFSKCSRMSLNLFPLVPTITIFYPILFRDLRSKWTRPTTPIPLSDFEPSLLTNPVVYSPVPNNIVFGNLYIFYSFFFNFYLLSLFFIFNLPIFTNLVFLFFYIFTILFYLYYIIFYLYKIN
jgi:hypothetical protein